MLARYRISPNLLIHLQKFCYHPYDPERLCIYDSMNPFNVDERDLLDGTERMRQARIPHISTSTSSSQYFGTRTIASNPAPNFTTINTNFYPNIQSRDSAHGHRQTPDGLDIFPQSPYEAAEGAVKEERRRRNTAASARFRQKKKQKEEAMETRMANVQNRNAELEERVNQLELENKWLKELITEKNRKPSSSYGDEQDELAASTRSRTANGTSVTDDGESSL
ncbi:hypothetical protein H2200_010177 [Cladophialophora chaetospira]|uniref:BZIP domain-containing protein n=1 Tax=Cladophialophora chaetospira TaxID=386627 RepID=A0AA38X2D6_9EURO|nr:hypothetical protein H2200_010177 [Cladophialophora chaetospira]